MRCVVCLICIHFHYTSIADIYILWQPNYCLQAYTGHNSPIMSLDFHPKKDLFCFCDHDNEIRYWNINPFSCTRNSKVCKSFWSHSSKFTFFLFVWKLHWSPEKLSVLFWIGRYCTSEISTKNWTTAGSSIRKNSFHLWCRNWQANTLITGTMPANMGLTNLYSDWKCWFVALGTSN